ncbi:MAG: hypothetical protein WA961_14735 [Rhodanobacter sp.]
MAEAETAIATRSDIEVLADNWTTVSVYGDCQLTFVGGAGGAVCTGIASLEVESAMRTRRLPRRDWQQVAAGVQLMGRTAAAAINARVNAAATSRR